MKIYLVGFMGCGKSTVGRILSQHLCLPFLDLDREVEIKVGQPIQKIFDERGEAFFREEEATLLKKLSGTPDFVMAVGGGLYVNPDNRDFIRTQGVAVWLKISFQAALQRGLTKGRPLAAEPGEFRLLFETRQEAYSEANLVFDCRDLPAEEVALKLAELLKRLPMP